MTDIASLTADRVYCAQRAAEEQELAVAATDPTAADTHRRLHKAYLERACIGARPAAAEETADA